ncbi:GMC oxidoreductase-domain-containing protein [Phakopsora pachyrhizi]|uniref:GMC oxidoreductase-domain-containing protein n=1 Tax=Phakopsora pachyrhizi TaxID=170000 RepID=A0AAV0BBS3_PHAPC|nr:GMC oxidoreductase-domain-containing protein [Phakopsora pachyrhizi]CAH7684798.1 GMC oxidoreductase-domain-containing protein [Phakopsora pachyrhizi]
MKNFKSKTPEFDVIIAGGGTAACVVAARLAEADRGLSILIIEGGKDNYELDNVRYPALFKENLVRESQSTLIYTSNKSEALNGRSTEVQAAGILGGGSSINYMHYSRALLQDFDSWNTIGWSGLEMKPILNKLETYHGTGKAEDHGFNGPVHISSGTFRSSRVEEDFIRAAELMGFPEAKDLQNLTTANACERSLRYISPDGIRQDTAHCYLHPLLRDGEHQNLHLLTESRVIRVLLDKNRRAVGVEYSPNPEFQLESTEVAKKHIARARKLVIVSCGALGTPSVLERSGVGSSEVLDRASVPVIVDLPGVGSNYQDHHGALVPYHTNLNPQETQDRYRTGDVDLKNALLEKDPQLGWNSVEVALKARPTDYEICRLGPSFQAAWDKDFKNSPTKPMMLSALGACLFGEAGPSISLGQYVTLGQYKAYPYSRGSIHITGPEIFDKVNFEVGYLDDPEGNDLKAHVWFYKKSREIMRRARFYRGEVKNRHPNFPLGSRAACTKGVAPKEPISEIKDLEYSEEDDVAIESYFRENIITYWHASGTAKMAPREEGGVVDQDLNVYGLSGIKVIDLSIIPKNVGANTNNTAIAVGEKGAEIVINYLKGLKESNCKI